MKKRSKNEFTFTVYSLWTTRKVAKKAAINRIKSQRGNRDILKNVVTTTNTGSLNNVSTFAFK